MEETGSMVVHWLTDSDCQARLRHRSSDCCVIFPITWKREQRTDNEAQKLWSWCLQGYHTASVEDSVEPPDGGFQSVEERRSGMEMYEAELDRPSYLAHKHYAASPSLMDYQVYGKTLFNTKREKKDFLS